MTTLDRPSAALTAARGHRPALDGLRALAVGGVVAYHFGAQWLPGGFLGVDLFFVLSGFLITSILVDEIDRRGRISFPTFFARRARRLLPALYVLILGVLAWAAFVATPQAIGDLRGAALAAILYVANWFFIVTGQSYFAEMLGPSPLEHTWSLSIEEQFYLLWPLLLVFLVRRAGAQALILVTTALLAISAAVMAVLYDAGDPSVAYFGTVSRAHELLVGCLLAIAVHRGLQLPRSLRWTAWLPLAGIVALMLTVQDTGAFYYRGGSLLFCALAAWVLLALGAGASGGGPTALLSWRPLVWIGLISYGIYLWHWPLSLWLTPASTGQSGWSLAAIRIAATVSIAAASFYLIERPIRRGTIAGYALTPRRLAVIVPIAMVVMGALVIAGTSRATEPAAESDVASVDGVLGDTSAGVPLVAIAGDSVPKELMPYLSSEAQARGWAVLPLAFGGCGVTGAFQVDFDGEPMQWSGRCSKGFADMQQRAIEKYQPDLVIWYSNRERYPVRVGDTVLQPGTTAHRIQLDRQLDEAYQRFTAQGAPIVIVSPVPKAPPESGTCAANGGTTPECVVDDAYFATFAEIADAFRGLADRHSNRVRIVRVDDLLCPGLRDCPALEQDGAAVRPDGIHFSPEGARWFVPVLLDRAGVTPG